MLDRYAGPRVSICFRARPGRPQHHEGGVLRRTTKFAACWRPASWPSAACGSDSDGGSDAAHATRPTSAARRRPTSRSAWPTTSAAAATSRSTTPPPPVSTRPTTELGVERRGVRGRGRRGRVGPRGAPAHLRRRRLQPDHRGRLRLRRLGRQGRRGVPGRQLRDHRRLQPRRRPERRQPGLRRGAGLVPGRRGRRAEDQDRPRRLHRWRRDAADPEVRGGLRGRRQGGQPGHQGRRHVPDPAAGLLRLR